MLQTMQPLARFALLLIGPSVQAMAEKYDWQEHRVTNLQNACLAVLDAAQEVIVHGSFAVPACYAFVKGVTED